MLRKFKIIIDNFEPYEGLFTDSCAATLDAMARHPHAKRISVRRMP